MALSPAAPPADAPVAHGIVLFTENKGPAEAMAGLLDPTVSAAEVIAWWGDIEREEGVYDWARLDAALEAWRAQGKRLDVRLSGAHNGPHFTPPWLFAGGRVRRVGRGPFADFEAPPIDYALSSSARLATRDSRSVLDVAAPGTWLLLREPVNAGPYSVQWDQSITRAGTFAVVARDASGHHPDVVHRFGDTISEWRSAGCELDLPEPGPWHLSWQLDGSAEGAFDNVLVVSLSNSREYLDTTAAGERAHWVLGEGASLESTEGREAVRLHNDSPTPRVVMSNNPATMPMGRLHGYAVRFQWQARADTAVVVRYRKGDDVLASQRVEMKAGESARKTCWFVDLLPEEGYALEFVLEGPGDATLTDVKVYDWSQRVPIFADYFDAEFRRCWSRFVEAFAERYGNDPALGVVSVGGFGRWEEVMLDEDKYGLLDAQWQSRGYTRERYLAHVEWCMDLYRRVLGDHELRICLAYGLHDHPDVAFFYRRVAQAAVRRRIGLKQNGLSERYDAWPGSTNTHTSTLFLRYADTPGVSLTHETGGQIYNNGMAAHGHPLSLFNRALLNQVDVLFLYQPDIAARHIHKYHAYFADQAGAGCISQFYTHLGDYSLLNEHSPRPVRYLNNWRGLRQFNHPGAEATYTTRDGERCVATSAAQPTIVFDLDDRWQHAGMFGAVLSLSYLDEGSEPFAVEVLDRSTDTRRRLGLVPRGDTGAWKVSSFADSAWCQSRADRGENVAEDLFVEHLGGPAVSVRSVELRFVGGSEWGLRDVARPAAASEAMSPLGATPITVEVAIVDRAQGVAAVELPLSVDGLAEASAHIRVVGMREGNADEVLLADKECYMPADGDWVRVPVAWAGDIASLRVEVTGEGAGLAWKHTVGTDTPCVAVLAHATIDGEASSLMREGSGWRAEIATPRPFAGLHLSGMTSGARGAVRIERVARGLQGTTRIVDWRDVALDAPLWFEPQPGGSFRIDVQPTAGADKSPPSVVLRHLERRRAPRPVSDPPPRGPLVAGWARAELAESSTPMAPSALSTPQGLALAARPSHRVRIAVANESGASLVRLYWRGPGEEFSAARSVMIPIVAHDATQRVVEFPVGFEDTWKGTIDQLALVPAYSHHPEDAAGISVGGFWLHESTVALELTFDASPQSLDQLGDASLPMAREDGAWRVDIPAGETPRLMVHRTLYDFDAESDQRLILRLRIDGGGAAQSRLRWHRLGHPTLDAKAAMVGDHEMSVPVSWSHAPNQWAEVQVELGALDSWRGRINAIGFSPLDQPLDRDVVVRIDTLRIERASAATVSHAPSPF